MSGTDPIGNGEYRSTQKLAARVRRMTASPLLYVGAITVVGVNELVEWLVEWHVLSEPHRTIALLPVTLALLYGQLTALAYYERKGHRRGCTES